MSWLQFDKCKTCENWKDPYEGCYMYRGGFCDDHSKSYKPLYSILEEENARLRKIDEKALYALMFTRGYIGEQIWSDIDSEYEIIKKALERGE